MGPQSTRLVAGGGLAAGSVPWDRQTDGIRYSKMTP